MMTFTFLQTSSTAMIALVVCVLTALFYFGGFLMRKRIARKNPESLNREMGSLNSTLLGLLGLFLAFTFSMSSARYDQRRNLVIEEANDIGTAVLRTDLYPDSTRLLLRQTFKEYVEARIQFYEARMDVEKIVFYYLRADSIGKDIWKIVATDAKVNNVVVRSGQMIPAVNAMIDITTTRRSAGESTVPDSIMYFLFALCFGSAFLLGYDNKNKIDWILVTSLALLLSITIYNIIDLDRTRSGYINLDVPSEKMKELRSMFLEP